MSKVSLVVAMLLVSMRAYAATYYVAPSGSDANPGTQTLPLGSIAQAQKVAVGGDTVYLRGGTYAFTSALTGCRGETDQVDAVLLDTQKGSAGKLVRIWAYAGERPIFDFAGVKDSCRIRGIHITGSWIHLKGVEVRGVNQNNEANAESWGVLVEGSNNILERLDVHHVMGVGIFLRQMKTHNPIANNLVLNCDAHHNFDAHTIKEDGSVGPGESADGFGCHVNNPTDTGNVFRGCRAWYNSDDGFDLLSAYAPVTIESSWAWSNGYEPDTMVSVGNGNGFKSGGYGRDTQSFPPDPVPQHLVRSCLAFSNKAAGFYANHHPGPLRFENNTGYLNHPSFRMLGITRDGGDVSYGLLRNNVAFGATLLADAVGVDDAYNSWSIANVTVNAADFQTLSAMGMDGPRQDDGRLPALPNFRLATGSDLIDQGRDVGAPFVGAAPDLGAFEFGAAEVEAARDSGLGFTDAGAMTVSDAATSIDRSAGSDSSGQFADVLREETDSSGEAGLAAGGGPVGFARDASASRADGGGLGLDPGAARESGTSCSCQMPGRSRCPRWVAGLAALAFAAARLRKRARRGRVSRPRGRSNHLFGQPIF